MNNKSIDNHPSPEIIALREEFEQCNILLEKYEKRIQEIQKVIEETTPNSNRGRPSNKRKQALLEKQKRLEEVRKIQEEIEYILLHREQLRLTLLYYGMSEEEEEKDSDTISNYGLFTRKKESVSKLREELNDVLDLINKHQEKCDLLKEELKMELNILDDETLSSKEINRRFEELKMVKQRITQMERDLINLEVLRKEYQRRIVALSSVGSKLRKG